MKFKQSVFLLLIVCITHASFAQDKASETVYKKRVLETAEVEFLTSYYTQ